MKGWEIAQMVPITSSYLTTARIAFSKARKHGFSEHDFQLLIDYLALHLSRANMYALANDLQKLADIDDSVSLEENSFLQLLHESWQLEEDSKHHQNKELLAVCKIFVLIRKRFRSLKKNISSGVIIACGGAKGGALCQFHDDLDSLPN